MLGPIGSLITLILASLGLAFASQLIYKKFTDQEKMKEIKEKTEKLQKKMKEAEMEKKSKYQSELMELSMKRMKLSMKPMLISSMLFLGIFVVLKYVFQGFILLEFSKSFPIIKDDVGWFLTYLIVSVVGNSVFRKYIRE